MGTALLAAWLCHHGNSGGCLEKGEAGRGGHHPNPYDAKVARLRSPPSREAPGEQATPVPYCALGASHRARGGLPSSISVSTWLRSGSRRTLYHPSLEEAATVPTTTRHWDLLIGASSSRLGCHNIDSTRQCLVAHKKYAIHSLAFLCVDGIIPVI